MWLITIDHLTALEQNIMFYYQTIHIYDSKNTATKITLSADHQPLKLTSTDVYTALSRINAHKAAGNRSTEDAVCTVLHSVLTRLDKNMYGCCLLTSAQHSTLSFPPSWPLNLETWALTPPSATGLWTFWPTDLSMLAQATPAPPPSHSTPAYHWAVCWAHSSTPSTPTTAGLCMDPTHHQVCRWHHSDWPHQRQRWDCIQGGGAAPGRMVRWQ